MNHIFLFCALALAPVVSSATSYPTVDVNGVQHFLADSDDTTGEWFNTSDGYCVRQGFQGMSQSASVPASSGPLVRLDSKGAVVETFADGKGGALWVVADVSCN